MNNIWRVCQGVALGSLLALSFSATAKAYELPETPSAEVQTPASDSATPNSSNASSVVTPPSVDDDPSWHFVGLTYLWFPGMHGTVGARGYDTTVHVSAIDVLKHFNIGLMGSFEADHKRWGLPFDYVWAKISDKQAFINFPGYSGKVTLKEGFFTPKVTYLVLDGKMVKVRATAGMRIWHMGENLQLIPPVPPNFSVGTSQNWVDVVAGANIVVPLSPKMYVMVLGDAGAGGANVDYQVAGLANYQIKPKWGIGLGYRYVDINYRNSNQVVIDTAQSGIALTLLYKFGKQQ
jgi:hypothetical protein